MPPGSAARCSIQIAQSTSNFLPFSGFFLSCCLGVVHLLVQRGGPGTPQMGRGPSMHHSKSKRENQIDGMDGRDEWLGCFFVSCFSFSQSLFFFDESQARAAEPQGGAREDSACARACRVIFGAMMACICMHDERREGGQVQGLGDRGGDARCRDARGAWGAERERGSSGPGPEHREQRPLLPLLGRTSRGKAGRGETSRGLGCQHRRAGRKWQGARCRWVHMGGFWRPEGGGGGAWEKTHI